MSDNIMIGQITGIRVSNNQLWMELLAIALESAPERTKEVLRKINQNDRDISALLVELSK